MNAGISHLNMHGDAHERAAPTFRQAGRQAGDRRQADTAGGGADPPAAAAA